MDKLKKFTKFILVIVSGACLIGASFFIYYNRPDSKSEDETSPEERTQETQEDIAINPKTIQDLKQTGWTTYYDHENGMTSLKNYGQGLSSVSPQWYSVSPEGNLIDQRNSDTYDMEVFCIENKIKLIPSIAVFDNTITAEILKDNNSRDQHVNAILSEVLTNNYDGIDIDYESIELEYKDSFLQFVSDLGAKLRDNNKMLTIAVIAKWGDKIEYTTLPQTRAVQDWEQIAPHVDEIRIMTYDYTSMSSSEPGPIAPIHWMEEVLKYAITKVPPEKIFLGIHLYSYEWPGKEYNPNKTTTSNETSSTSTNSYLQEGISNIIQAPNVQIEYKKDLAENIAIYPCQEFTKCTMFYPNENTVLARKQLAANYGIGGVAYWRFGSDNGIFNVQ